jgi:hypothetical protein
MGRRQLQFVIGIYILAACAGIAGLGVELVTIGYLKNGSQIVGIAGDLTLAYWLARGANKARIIAAIFSIVGSVAVLLAFILTPSLLYDRFGSRLRSQAFA